MTRLVRAELFKLRTTSLWWLMSLAALLVTAATLAINCVSAHSLLKPFDQYVLLNSHGHSVSNIPADFLSHLHTEWLAGHSAVTQAATIFTSGQLLGVLLTCLLGIVLITGEYQQQTATTTFLLTPQRTRVVLAKLITAVGVAGLVWLVSTAIDLVVGTVFLHSQGVATHLTNGGVVRAVLLNLVAYVLWAVFGIGLGALIRSQLAATVLATVLYLVGVTVASTVFELINTYVIKHDWVLSLQVVVPAVASAVMISPTKTFDTSPPQWVGAAVLIAYGLVTGVVGTLVLRRRDIA